MDSNYQIITSVKDFSSLRSIIEENNLKNFNLGKATYIEAKKESEDFMKSTFSLHKIYKITPEEINESIPAEALSEMELLREYNKLGHKIDAYSLQIKLVNREYDYGVIANTILPLTDKTLLCQAKIMYHYIALSNKITNLTGRIISHEITHSQIDSNRGAIKYLQNYEIIPIFVELIHKSTNKDSALITNIDIMIRANALLKQISYFQNKISLDKEISKDNETDVEKSTEFFSTLKALNLYEIYLNSNILKKQELINQIQKIFDGKMQVEELLAKYDITIEKGIESTKRLVKATNKNL